MTLTVKKEFDPKAFLEGVPKPKHCSVPEWAEANFLMSVCSEMDEANLSEDQQNAVFTCLRLTPKNVAHAIKDGFAAVYDAEREVYGETIDDRLSARDILDEEF